MAADLFVANVDQEMFSFTETIKTRPLTTSHTCTDCASYQAFEWLGAQVLRYDNDGAVDLILANGHPDDMIGRYSKQVRYQGAILLFHQGPDGKLKNVSSEAGRRLKNSFAAGLAVGDFDNDGALDVLIATNGGLPCF